MLLERLIKQTEFVLAGVRVPDRMVSIFDTTARPFRKGKAGKSAEFGREVQIQEDERFITGWAIHNKPSDTAYFTQAIEQHKRVHGKAPREAAEDRGYWSPENEQKAKEAGIVHVSIAKKGKQAQPQDGALGLRKWRALQRWRAGGEARISLFKRKYGGRRSLYQREAGMARWVGAGIIACNLATFARIALATGGT
jgi:IS5 family transposase